jgi:FkbM family methyltransferase
MRKRRSSSVKSVLWLIKTQLELVPGAFRLYKLLTSLSGEGKVYRIKKGVLAGAVWKRYNRLPYWYHRGIYEPHLSEYIFRHLRPGDVFWDIGAHAGYHTLVAALAVGSSGRVVAVEPDPDHCAILREQMALNGVRQCDIVEAAVSDHEGILTLMRQDADSRTNALSDLTQTGEPIQVRGITLDALAEQYPAPNLVKIDIEGAETLALPAAKAFFFGKSRPLRLIVATHGEIAKRVCIHTLEANGYRLNTRDNDTVTLFADDAEKIFD